VGRAAEPVGVGGFEIGYVTDDGLEHRGSLSQAWATPFESCSPDTPVHLTQGAAASERAVVVGHDRRARRLRVVDGTRSRDGAGFRPDSVGIASQPFWLSWRDEAGKLIWHAPDFFARRADGTSVVVDCRPVERRKPRDAAKFEATARACAMVGWNYRLVGAPDPIVTANLRWLAGYRHPRHDLPDVREVLRRVYVTPTPLMAGTAAAGDPIAVLPVLFHLLWRGVLAVDVSVPLHQDTVARCGAAGR
jgi:hypothetical protein